MCTPYRLCWNYRTKMVLKRADKNGSSKLLGHQDFDSQLLGKMLYTRTNEWMPTNERVGRKDAWELWMEKAANKTRSTLCHCAAVIHAPITRKAPTSLWLFWNDQSKKNMNGKLLRREQTTRRVARHKDDIWQHYTPGSKWRGKDITSRLKEAFHWEEEASSERRNSPKITRRLLLSSFQYIDSIHHMVRSNEQAFIKNDSRGGIFIAH